MSDVELVVLADADAVAAAVADLLAQAARKGGHIALTGGRTPELAYEEAATLEQDWSNVELWWSDERCVPPDDDLSNYALAKRTLLDNLSSAPRQVHRIKGELGKERAAGDYERELGDMVFDLELLGVGPDGHVASLFPNAP
ncbi:MAG: 6-phosphogluconolactonase, partial [Gaiellaceae bacterium]|nr:6-phosphogluconolactonase [Gaiellaceae bacterium]